MPYNYETLIEFCKEHNIILCEDYSAIPLNRDTFITGICESENCDKTFTKGFRALLKPNGYCQDCAKIIGKEKAKKTNLEKYGLEFTTQVQSIKDKIKNTFLERYGVEHISHITEIKEKTKQTCLQKYGVDAPAKHEEIKDKIKKTNLEKYGYENPLQNEDVKHKIRKTCFEKYGFEYASQNENVKNKRKKTNLEKYGTSCTLHNKDIKQKIINTWLLKYGLKSPNQSEEIKQRKKQTCLQRYGVEHPSQLEEIKQKKRETCLSNFGVEHPSQNPDIFNKQLQNSYKFKLYTFPSGKVEKIQGYEKFMIDELLQNNISEEDIIVSRKNVPEIWFDNVKGTKSRYFMDCFVKSENKCIEVKSLWTLQKEDVFIKFQAVKDAGFASEIWVYDNKGNKIQTYK